MRRRLRRLQPRRRRAVGQCPFGDGVVAEDDCPLRARHLQGLRAARPGTRRAVDGTERAALEADRRTGGILRLHRVRERRREAPHLRDGRHERREPVDHVDGLVHQCAAAVQRARAVPGRFRVVGVVAPPRHRDARVGEAAEPSRPHGGQGRLERGRPPRLADTPERRSRRGAGGSQCVEAGRRNRKRLLHEHRQTAFGGGKDGLVVRAARRRDHEEVGIRPCERGPPVARAERDASREFKPVARLDRLLVEAGDESRPQDQNAAARHVTAPLPSRGPDASRASRRRRGGRRAWRPPSRPARA